MSQTKRAWKLRTYRFANRVSVMYMFTGLMSKIATVITVVWFVYPITDKYDVLLVLS